MSKGFKVLLVEKNFVLKVHFFHVPEILSPLILVFFGEMVVKNVGFPLLEFISHRGDFFTLIYFLNFLLVILRLCGLSWDIGLEILLILLLNSLI